MATYYTRFHRSREDFILTNKEAISDDIAEAACIFEEVDELECETEDSEDKAMYNKFQVIANMIRRQAKWLREQWIVISCSRKLLYTEA